MPIKWVTVKVNGRIHQMSQEKHDNILNYSKRENGEVNWELFFDLIESGTSTVLTDTYQPSDEDFATGNF